MKLGLEKDYLRFSKMLKNRYDGLNFGYDENMIKSTITDYRLLPIRNEYKKKKGPALLNWGLDEYEVDIHNISNYDLSEELVISETKSDSESTKKSKKAESEGFIRRRSRSDIRRNINEVADAFFESSTSDGNKLLVDKSVLTAQKKVEQIVIDNESENIEIEEDDDPIPNEMENKDIGDGLDMVKSGVIKSTDFPTEYKNKFDSVIKYIEDGKAEINNKNVLHYSKDIGKTVQLLNKLEGIKGDKASDNIYSELFTALISAYNKVNDSAKKEFFKIMENETGIQSVLPQVKKYADMYKINFDGKKYIFPTWIKHNQASNIAKKMTDIMNDILNEPNMDKKKLEGLIKILDKHQAEAENSGRYPHRFRIKK